MKLRTIATTGALALLALIGASACQPSHAYPRTGAAIKATGAPYAGRCAAEDNCPAFDACIRVADWCDIRRGADGSLHPFPIYYR